LKTQKSATELSDSLGWYIDGFTRGEAGGRGYLFNMSRRARSLSTGKQVARYNPGRDNKSLNRSGFSGLGIRKTRMLV
jgi:hypothetical protein